MYLIAGLGNPGIKYQNTRHNIGFMVIDKLAGFFKIKSFKSEELYLAAMADYNENIVILMKPMTYMNLSGRAVKEFSDRFEIPKENILVVYDDVNLNYGTMRIRPAGSDGGQNGIKSVIFEFESEEIPRLRIGIRNEEELEKVKNEDGSYDLAEYVLNEFSGSEAKELDKVVTAATGAVLSFISTGIQETMNNYNKNFIE
jgi:PTH1 family peptidyl-tRNA hydrolase